MSYKKISAGGGGEAMITTLLSLLFQCAVYFVVNWCQKWFEFFPNPPLTILGIIETVLSHNDRHLMEHFVNVKVTTQVFNIFDPPYANNRVKLFLNMDNRE